jgi:hypothetical protein
MKTKYLLGFMILFAVALAQNGSTPRARELVDAVDRQASIRSCLEELDQQQRMDKMPGVGGPTIEQKLLRVLAEEVLSLRQENAALKQAIEQPKKNG